VTVCVCVCRVEAKATITLTLALKGRVEARATKRRWGMDRYRPPPAKVSTRATTMGLKAMATGLKAMVTTGRG